MRTASAALAAFALLLAAPAARADEPDRTPPRMTITGRATIEAKPDYASISIGVTNKAATTAAAIDATSAAAAKIVASARAFGIAPRDVQTSYVALRPAFRVVRDGSSSEQRPDGYTASNAVVVRVRDLGKLGEFLRNVVDGGANQIGGVSFELNDPGKLEREALAAAVRDAREQAGIVAEAAGVTIARIETIDTGGSSRPRAYAAPAPARAVRQEVPVEPGSLDVGAEVQVTFSFGPK